MVAKRSSARTLDTSPRKTEMMVNTFFVGSDVAELVGRGKLESGRLNDAEERAAKNLN